MNNTCRSFFAAIAAAVVGIPLLGRFFSRYSVSVEVGESYQTGRVFMASLVNDLQHTGLSEQQALSEANAMIDRWSATSLVRNKV